MILPLVSLLQEMLHDSVQPTVSRAPTVSRTLLNYNTSIHSITRFKAGTGVTIAGREFCEALH